jgi:hypothetical protein
MIPHMERFAKTSVIERRPVGEGTTVRIEQSGFRPEDEGGYRAMGGGRGCWLGWRTSRRTPRAFRHIGRVA